MTTLAIIFFSIVLLGASAVLLAVWSAERKTRNAFRKTDHDKARTLLRKTLKQIHP